MSPPLLSRAPAARAPRATGAEFDRGAPLVAGGRALQDVADVSARILDNAQRAKAHRAAGDALRRLREKASEIALTPEPEKHPQLWDEATTEAREEFGTGLAPGYSDLFEEDFAEFESRLGIEVRTNAHKLSLEQAAADDDYLLQQLSDEAARAPDEDSRRAIDAKAARVLGQAKASGQWDQKDVDKRARAYEAAGADAAVARGLANDPVALKGALEARVGVFAAMREPDRQKAILAADKRIDADARAGRGALAAQRAEESAQRAREREAQRQAREQATRELAALGAPGAAGVTPDDVLSRLEALGSSSTYWLGVAGKGGYITDPEALTPTKRAAIAQEEARLARLSPEALAREPLDAEKLGPEIVKWQERQTKLRERPPGATTSFASKVKVRISLGTLDPTGFGDPLLEDTGEAGAAFAQRAQLALIEWQARTKKEPSDAEQDEILDGVILQIAAERRAEGFDYAETIGPELGVNPRTLPRDSGAIPTSLPRGSRAHPTRAGVFILPDGRLVERDE